MSAIGSVALRRQYHTCPTCETGQFPADVRVGVEGKWSDRARQFACLFSIGWGFDQAAENLAQICGWKASARTLSRLCYQESPRIEQWREASPAEEFAAAEGEIEFQTDGTMVNTVETGWTEVRVGMFLKRIPGAPVRAALWAARQLPAPTVRSIRVFLGTAEEFAATWRDWAATLGIAMFCLITVLGDGAKWIWHQARIQFPTARGVLDIFHVLEHVATATRSVYGEKSGASLAWKDSALMALLGDGWPGFCDWVGRWREREEPQWQSAIIAATDSLIRYLKEHLDHLGYCERLAKGLSIGSGQIESANKYVIGRRLKRTGGRWRTGNVRKMGTLCSTQYAGDWTDYWKSRLTTLPA